MNQSEKDQSIRETIDGLFDYERALVLRNGSGRTRRTFYVHFPADREYCTDNDAREILEAVRDEFPDWKITGTRTPADVFARQQQAAADKRRLVHDQRMRQQ